MALLTPGQPVRQGLLGIAWCYGLLVTFRLWCFQRGWVSSSRLPCRVISVGNLTVGGTGKTPIVILLADWLQANGQRVAILSRGYKRRSGEQHVLVSDGTRILVDASSAGDEPFLMAQRCPRAIVAVGADRARLGQWVLEQFPVDCMILDDGFQHWSLRRDVDLVLLDAMDAVGLDAMLPAGRLREPLSGLARATAVLITRADRKQDVDAVCSRLQDCRPPVQDCIEVVFNPESLWSVQKAENRPREWCHGKRVWLASGIGNSAAFRRSVADMGANILGETVFQDHHYYSVEDVRTIQAAVQGVDGEIVLTTEKDAAKLSALLGPNDPWWALRLHTIVARGEARLRRLVLGEDEGR